MKDSARWYDKEGNCILEVENKSKGGMRRPTVKDARSLGLYPSCTTILGVLDKPELKVWQYNQILLAAQTLPRKEGETDEVYNARIIEDAFQQVDDAADKGKAIHAAIENHFQGNPYDRTYKSYIDLVEKWVRDNHVTFLKHELRMVNEVEKYAGTTDALIKVEGKDGTAILDFKTRKSKPEYPMKPWATEPMQIAAYAAQQGATFGVNVYLSTTEEGRIEACWYDKERLEKEYAAFRCANHLFRHLKNL